MKRFLQIALGIVTSIGGFLDAGSIATSAQAGASFRFQLLWPVALGTICVIFLIEMSGRLAAISHHPLPSAVRERFGFNFFVFPLAAETIVDLLVLASEIGGACYGLQMLTGISFHWWAVPVALLLWGLLWYGNFGMVEYGVSTLGLITIIFVIAAFKMHPHLVDVARGMVPTLPTHEKAHYWFLAVSIVGATLSPYLVNFYSSGAVEDKWDESSLGANRITSIVGMGFGGVMSAGVLIAAGAVFFPRAIKFENYVQLPMLGTVPLGQWAYWIVGGALFIACFGAALELSLDIAYVYAQAFGWKWGEDQPPRDAARFSLT